MHANHSHTYTHTEAEFTRIHVPTYVCMPVCKRYTVSLSYIVPQLPGYWPIVCYRHHKHRQTFMCTQTHGHRETERQTHIRMYRQETAPVCMNALYCIVWSTPYIRYSVGIGSHTSHHILMHAVGTKCDLRRYNAVCLNRWTLQTVRLWGVVCAVYTAQSARHVCGTALHNYTELGAGIGSTLSSCQGWLTRSTLLLPPPI